MKLAQPSQKKATGGPGFKKGESLGGPDATDALEAIDSVLKKKKPKKGGEQWQEEPDAGWNDEEGIFESFAKRCGC